MTVVGSDLPPEIKRLVDEAGVDNALWWSNRWRHGKKPDVGDAADEVTNTVPGSSIEASQSTTSAQPFSDNSGYDFQGDDGFSSSGSRDIMQATLAVVLDGRSINAEYCVSFSSSSTSSIIAIRQPNSLEMITRDDSDTITKSATTVDSTAKTAVAVAAFDFSADSAYLTAINENGTDSNTMTPSPGTYTDNQVYIGRRAGGGQIEAVEREVAAFHGVATSNARADDLRDRLAQRHGITT